MQRHPDEPAAPPLHPGTPSVQAGGGGRSAEPENAFKDWGFAAEPGATPGSARSGADSFVDRPNSRSGGARARGAGRADVRARARA